MIILITTQLITIEYDKTIITITVKAIIKQILIIKAMMM